MSTLTPNMNLIVSTIGVDSGLLWEQNLNNDLTTIDQHNHSPGNGVQIQPSGININGPLSFNNQQATAMQAVLFQDQTSLATLNALYTKAGELYFNDPTGVVQLTAGGLVNATSSGISSGAASASFVSSVLVVNQAANTPGNIQAGSILIGNNVAASNFVTLSAPAALAASYTLVLPQVPASTSIMQLDSSGNMSAALVVDNSTLEISSNILRVKDLGIVTAKIAASAVTTAKIADGAVTPAKMASPTYQVSSSCGTFTSTSASFTAVTNLSVTITTTGRPVMLMLQTDGATSSRISTVSSSGTASAFYEFFRGATGLGDQELQSIASTGGNMQVFTPPGSVNMMDVVAAGTYTYTFKVKAGSLNTVGVQNCVLVAALPWG